MERLFGDDVKNLCLDLHALIIVGIWRVRRLLRWDLGVVPVIKYHFNAVPVLRSKDKREEQYFLSHAVFIEIYIERKSCSSQIDN